MFFDGSYDEIIEKLFRQHPSYQQVGGAAYKEGIETMVAFDHSLSSPHKSYPVIHVAGTNGKGSVSHMLASVFMSCGIKTGLYTSPHLSDFRERIKVDGVMVSKDFVLKFLQSNDHFISEYKPSFFEITTAMAFDYFRQSGVDIAVIETGLGGRLDSTNIVSPLLTVITNISTDHSEYLGNTIGAIAKEKAGIIKDNVPVVVGEYNETTRSIFEDTAQRMGSQLFFASESAYSEVSADDYELDLYGDYQVYNLRTALLALKVLSRNPLFLGIAGERWSDASIREGLSTVKTRTGLRGRWEYLSQNPPVICDTGHNVSGLTHVISQLERQDYKRLFCAVGFMKDKEIDKLIGILPVNAYFFFTQAGSGRALSARLLGERCSASGLEGEVCESVEQSVRRFRELFREGDLLFIGGSSYVVSEAITFFEKNDIFFAN
jgi:dihydrofolate synthase/folylpolyglutamate synthase